MKAFATLVLGLSLLLVGATGARAEAESFFSCRIEGQSKQVSVTLTADTAAYRFGPADGPAELTLSAPLSELDYRRRFHSGGVLDEVVAFTSGDHAYELSMGFRSGIQPDPTALHPFGDLKVSRAGTVISTLSCEPSTIERAHDLLLAHMRAIGREKASDGQSFNNYDIPVMQPAAVSPPCEQADNTNVDTCWSRGVTAERRGDLRGALEHFDMSCDAGQNLLGCYSAAKFSLLNRQLRNYPHALELFARICREDASTTGPYACKYLGWMHHTGIGAPRNDGLAMEYLAKACFPDGEDMFIDPEGCHFLSESLSRAPMAEARGPYAGYLALAMGCTDAAEGLCRDALALIASERAKSAAWIASCDLAFKDRRPVDTCTDLAAPELSFEDRQSLRRQIRTVFNSLAPERR